jgi:hypothetical protein
VRNVYFEHSCGSKFGNEEFYQNNIRPARLLLPCVLFSHKTYKELISDIQINYRSAIQSRKISICYFSDSPNCGLTSDQLVSIRLEFSDFVHIYQNSVPNLSIGEDINHILMQRIMRFAGVASNIDDGSAPDWQILYPEDYPESLVAAYLLLVVEQDGLVVNSLDNSGIWCEAFKEYQNNLQKYSDIATEKITVGGVWVHPTGFNVKKYADRIRILFSFLDKDNNPLTLSPFNIPCEANTIRGQLKHSWLENQLCNKTGEKILALWRNGQWAALNSEFDVRFEETYDLINSLNYSFCPSQLIDKISWFILLSENERKFVKEILHKRYLNNTNILELKVPLIEKTNALKKAILSLRNSWDIRSSGSEIRIRNSWDEVLSKAKDLLEIFKKLPKGIVIP